MMKTIYLDYNATTPVDPAVLAAMRPYLEEHFGNPSSKSHAYGWEAEAAVTKARGQMAQHLGADPSEIFWTSGATESNNMAIFGVVRQFLHARPHIITSSIEHKAVLDVCKACEEWGAEITILPVNAHGQVELDTLAESLRPNTRLISIMMANNEIGSINPIAAIGKIAKDRGIFFHVDAAQGAGKMPLDVNALGIDLLSISGHKIYGPKGVGALYVRKKNPTVKIKPLMTGGAQECGLRPGTLNVPGIVGLGMAMEISCANMESENARLKSLQSRLISEVLQLSPRVRLNGHPTDRLCNNVSFSFPHLSADLFALGLSGLAVSSGSACTSGQAEPSHVLTAIGHTPELARATVRIGLGRSTTSADIDVVIEKIVSLIKENQVISIA